MFCRRQIHLLLLIFGLNVELRVVSQIVAVLFGHGNFLLNSDLTRCQDGVPLAGRCGDAGQSVALARPTCIQTARNDIADRAL